MSSPAPEPAATAPLAEPPAPRPPSRRRRWLGSLAALLFVLALGGGAWYLIKRSGEPVAGRGGFGAPGSTVGHAVARRA